ncbi:MAG: hypothetical protein EPN97_18945 [Alphaproteobacteria bacterium]|nr:MAG: hypothetical protein EPN97_18945 [Alphaproteobacteria bacterium]
MSKFTDWVMGKKDDPKPEKPKAEGEGLKDAQQKADAAGSVLGGMSGGAVEILKKNRTKGLDI